MKKVRNNINLIVIFILLFLTFPIQNILNRKTNILTLSILVNMTLIIISLYFISKFIANLLKFIEKYNDEISRKNLISLSLLNNNTQILYDNVGYIFIFHFFNNSNLYFNRKNNSNVNGNILMNKL